MPHIRPISVFRDTTKISKLCHSTQEPIFITKNGYGDMVIMSIETYERELARAELYSKLTEAEAETRSGAPLQEAEEVFEKLRAKHDQQ